MSTSQALKISREKFEVSFHTDQALIVISLKDDQTLEKTDIIDMVNVHLELTAHRKHFRRIIHSGKFSTIESDARKYLQEAEIPVDAEAYILHSLAQKILFNVYVKLRKPQHPVKAFSDYDEGLKWLNSLTHN